MKKLIALLLAVVMVVGLFAACDQAEVEPTAAPTQGNAEQPTEGNKETEAPTAAPETESETPLVIQWDQANGTDKVEPPYKDSSLSYHTHFLWAQLGKNDQSKKGTPDEIVWELATAEGYDASTLTYWTTIREGAKWSDGEPITAEDVVWTMLAMTLDPISTGVSAWKYVEGYEAVANGEAEAFSGVTIEGNKIIVKLTEDQAEFTLRGIYVLPKHCFEGIAWADLSNADYWNAPVSSGPYKFVEAQFPDFMKLTRNENYYGQPAGIKNVTCLSFEAAGAEAAIASVIAGDSHITTRTVTTDGLVAKAILEGNADCVSHVMPSEAMRSYVFNMGQRTDGKNKDVLVKSAKARHAISLLIDEEALAAYMGGIPCKVFGSPMNPITIHDYDDVPAYDPEQAKKILTEEGWNFDDTIDMICYYTDQGSLDCGEILKADFAAAGVKLNYIIVTENASVVIYTDMNWDMMYYNAGASDVDPTGGLNNIIGASWTFMHPCTEIVDMFTPLVQTKDATNKNTPERTAACQALQKLNAEQTIIIPLYVNSFIAVHNAGKVYIPETAFDFYDSVLDLHLWKMLV